MLWLPDGIDRNERERRLSAAFAMLKGIDPQNELGRMLGTQMVATHEAALRREDPMRNALPFTGGQGEAYTGHTQTSKRPMPQTLKA